MHLLSMTTGSACEAMSLRHRSLPRKRHAQATVAASQLLASKRALAIAGAMRAETLRICIFFAIFMFYS